MIQENIFIFGYNNSKDVSGGVSVSEWRGKYDSSKKIEELGDQTWQ